ncbi:MAG TPA: hypothetical protein VJ440_08125, partial [Candidatus Brocadiaceae bacterium]|nr:hypothetical protein [Candidatus Brocadiaceae bacterium]
MPFIANNGQMDEQVRFYAKTFGGTVFVTKEGEIVYSLPSGRDVPAGASQESQESERGLKHGGIGAVAQGGMVVLGWQGQAVLVRAESEFAANGYVSFLHVDNAQCLPDRVLANTLIATYFPALQGSTGKIVGTRCPCPPPLAYLSGLQKSTDKQDVSMPPIAIKNPQSPIKGVALKEHLVGGKANEIQGGVQSVTTVSYFKGNDPSKWKNNLSTYEVVDMGEVYDGIGLRLKAYGNNVEKLFTVTPDASPEAIKLGLSGATALRVNEDGQLEAETELGPVKFTKPVAYQEIDGNRVEVAVEYKIHGEAGEEGRGAGVQGRTGNPKSETRNSKLTYGF